MDSEVLGFFFVYSEALCTNTLYFTILMPIWLLVNMVQIIAIILVMIKPNIRKIRAFRVLLLIDLFTLIGFGFKHAFANLNLASLIVSALVTGFYLVFQLVLTLTLLSTM